MKVNRTTAAIVAVALAALFALDAWGESLGMAPEALDRVRTAVAGLSTLIAAMAGRLLSRDDDGDGMPDWLQRLLGLALAGVSWLAAAAVRACRAFSLRRPRCT
jgi:hypothetical protein